MVICLFIRVTCCLYFICYLTSGCSFVAAICLSECAEENWEMKGVAKKKKKRWGMREEETDKMKQAKKGEGSRRKK